MLVLILGDCHGNLDQVHEACTEAQRLWGIHAAIQVGDFGFFPNIFTRFMNRSRHRFPVPLHVIDGNHENHHWLNDARASGVVASWKQFNLHYQDRGTTDQLDGTVVGYLGGALHADRRQEWSSKWTSATEERPPLGRRRVPRDPPWANWVTDGDCDRAITAFNAAPPDLVVTHSCPAGIGIGMVGDSALIADASRFITRAGFQNVSFTDCGESALTRVWKSISQPPPLWVFGHFHRLQERSVGATRFVCVGSTDNSDGVSGVRPVLYDTRTHDLQIHADILLGGA